MGGLVNTRQNSDSKSTLHQNKPRVFLFFFFLSNRVCFRAEHRFKEAVAGVLAEDGQADLTYMVADYLAYSSRVQRSCVIKLKGAGAFWHYSIIALVTGCLRRSYRDRAAADGSRAGLEPGPR